jgi:hypothetical protein
MRGFGYPDEATAIVEDAVIDRGMSEKPCARLIKLGLNIVRSHGVPVEQ